MLHSYSTCSRCSAGQPGRPSNGHRRRNHHRHCFRPNRRRQIDCHRRHYFLAEMRHWSRRQLHAPCNDSCLLAHRWVFRVPSNWAEILPFRICSTKCAAMTNSYECNAVDSYWNVVCRGLSGTRSNRYAGSHAASISTNLALSHRIVSMAIPEMAKQKTQKFSLVTFIVEFALLYCGMQVMWGNRLSQNSDKFLWITNREKNNYCISTIDFGCVVNHRNDWTGKRINGGINNV